MSAGRTAPTTVEKAYRRDRATWVAFVALFAFGLLNALLGPVLPYLRATEHLSYIVGALHQVAFALGGGTAGVLASRSNAPRRRTIVAGLAGAAAAGVVLGYGRLLPITLVAAFLVSACATAALIRVWAVLADLHHRHRAVAMTEGEVSVSLAGIVAPIVVSVCAAAVVGWRFAFVIAFVLVVLAAGAVRGTALPAPIQPESQTVDGRAAAASPWRTLGTIFGVVGLEFTLSFWATSYLHDDVGIEQDTAVALVSVLYAANLAGRLIVSRLARRTAPVTVLRLALATALAGAPILLTAHSLAQAAIGLAISGAGIGGTFPIASSLHVSASGRTADQALGQILTVAGIGEIVGPVVAGAIAEAADLRVGLLAMPALALLAAATTRTRRRPLR